MARNFTIPLAVVAGLGAGLAEPATLAYQGDWEAAAVRLCQAYTGYGPIIGPHGTGEWKLQNLTKGLIPLMVGVFIHKIASKLGINRALGQAGIPFFRI